MGRDCLQQRSHVCPACSLLAHCCPKQPHAMPVCRTADSSNQWRRWWILPWGRRFLFWSHFSIRTPLCCHHVVICHFFSLFCLAFFQHLPIHAQSHRLPTTPENQPLTSLAPNHCPISFCPFKSLSQRSSTHFLCYSQDGKGEERDDLNLHRRFLGITAVL